MIEEQEAPQGSMEGTEGAPPGQDRGRRGLIIGIVIALAAVTAGAGTWVLVSRLGSGGAETPEEAIRGYYEAIAAGDCAEVASFVDPSFASEQEICSGLQEATASAGTLESIGEVDLRGDRAFVIASRTVDGLTDQRIVTVNKLDAGWMLAGGNACWGEEYPDDMGNDHLAEGETYAGYSSSPPTSGPHAPQPAETGTIYETAQPVESLVHSMEHGAVVFWTNGMDEALQQHAEDTVVEVYDQGYESLVVTPGEGLADPFTMTAWGVVQRCVGVDAESIQTFVDTHYGSGLEGMMACFGSAATLPGCAGKGY